MPRAFYPIDELTDKADNYFIITAEYELVFDTNKLNIKSWKLISQDFI